MQKINLSQAIALAKKHTTTKAFKKAEPAAFNLLVEKSLYHVEASHLNAPHGYWTKERCAEEALKYSNRTEFKNSYCSAYNGAKNKGWLQEICAHMPRAIRENGYWSKEKCAEEASKYLTRGEFRKNSNSCYVRASVNGWINEICSHMRLVSTGGMYCIYAIRNEKSKKIYIGLTSQHIDRRILQHKGSSDCRSRELIYLKGTVCEAVTEYILTPEEASKMEVFFYKKYQRMGYKVLNSKSKLGALGASEQTYTDVEIIFKAFKFNTYKDFVKKSGSLYSLAHRRGLLIEIGALLGRMDTTKGYWTKERCAKEALKYKNRKQFKLGSPSADSVARKNKWHAEICSHMERIIKPKGYWTKECCAKEALKYESKKDFASSSGAAYDFAKRRHWLNDICSHMLT